MFFVYALIVLLIGFLYSLLKALHNHKQLKEKMNFYLLKIEMELEKDPNNPFAFCIRATIFQIMQNFSKAKEDYLQALMLIDAGYPLSDDPQEIKSIIRGNIKYIEKPLPWSKGPVKDLSNSWFTRFLIIRFGNQRTNFPVTKL